MSVRAFKTVALIGFGEAGGIIGAGLARWTDVRAYDLLQDDPVKGGPMRAKAAAAGVAMSVSHEAAVRGADLVISAVTAASSVDAAKAVAAHIGRGQFYLDINSVSPETKRASALAVEAGGADYVEAAVMAALPAKKLATPMLLGGRRAAHVAEGLARMGFAATAVADTIGVASAIKMCRSVMIKGLEALTVECLLGARRYGAEAEVLASLHGTFPGMGWDAELPNYLVSRVAEHGKRRAAEMREVAATLEDGGIAARMATATAGLHDWLVDALAARGHAFKSNGAFDWRLAVDALLDGSVEEAMRENGARAAAAPASSS